MPKAGRSAPLRSALDRADAPRGWPMFAAVLTILLGVFVIALWPVNSLFLLGALLAVDLIVQGVGWISFGLALRRRRD